MKKRGLKEPSLPKELFPVKLGKEFLEEAKEQETEVVRRKIEKVYLTKFDGSGMSFWQTVFQNCRFEGCDFHKAFFQDVKFVNCSFCHSSFCDANFKSCIFESCKGRGADFYGSSLYHVQFQDCDMGEAVFDAARFSSVKGQNTDFSKAGFSKCRMSNTVWEQVCFREAKFFKTVLKDKDSPKRSIEGIVLSDERGELEGAVVNTFQALGLAKRLGLVIQDSGENF